MIEKPNCLSQNQKKFRRFTQILILSLPFGTLKLFRLETTMPPTQIFHNLKSQTLRFLKEKLNDTSLNPKKICVQQY